ncbi:MAG: hypothetical protein JWM10_5069 [Myxococcaceae bacterium]|nr:hypothetical protein [Myxococcaceae bacterium]
MPIPRAEFFQLVGTRPQRLADVDAAVREAGRLALEVVAAAPGDFFGVDEIVLGIEAIPSACPADVVEAALASLPGALAAVVANALAALVAAGRLEAQVLDGETYYALRPAG